MGGKAVDGRRARPRAAAPVASAIATIRAWLPWDEARVHASKAARTRAWASYVRTARKVAAAVEELARAGQHDALVGLLDHPNDEVRADVAAVLLGHHTAAQGGRPARWGRADDGAIAAVAGLLGSRPSRTDYRAAGACFAIDPAAAVARFAAELSPAALDPPGAERRWCDIVRATPADLGAVGEPWHRALAGALTWAPYSLAFTIVHLLETVAPRHLVAALALPLPDDGFDRLMARLAAIEDPSLPSWLADAAGTSGIAPGRAARLRALSGGRPPKAAARVAELRQVAQAGWDGGPMLLLPGRVAAAWEGADPPSGGRVVDCAYRHDDPDAPATDYDRACEASRLRAALVPAGSGHALVTPQSFVAVATCAQLDGFFAIIQGEDELIARWALAGRGARWRTIGKLTVGADRVLWAQSAALRGGDRRATSVELPAGTYQLAELAFYDERGELHLVRARRLAGGAKPRR